MKSTDNRLHGQQAGGDARACSSEIIADAYSLPHHTPGPWIWDGYALRPEVPNPDGSAVHTILEANHMGWGYLMSDHIATIRESDANRPLIAAAPELLGALRIAEEFMVAFENDDSQTGVGIKLAIIRAAIAKAEGRA